MRHGHQTRPVGEQSRQRLQVQRATLIDGDYSQPHALQLPRHNVRVMLHRRDNHLVTRLHASACITRSHKVDRLRRAPREDDLCGRRCIQKRPHGLTRGLMRLRSLLAEKMHTAVNVGVDVVIGCFDLFHHATRLLRRGGIIEINKRPVVDLTPQDGKVFPDTFYI